MLVQTSKLIAKANIFRQSITIILDYGFMGSLLKTYNGWKPNSTHLFLSRNNTKDYMQKQYESKSFHFYSSYTTPENYTKCKITIITVNSKLSAFVSLIYPYQPSAKLNQEKKKISYSTSLIKHFNITGIT